MFISKSLRLYAHKCSDAVASAARLFAGVENRLDESNLDSVLLFPRRLHSATHVSVSGHDIPVADVLSALLKHTGFTPEWHRGTSGEIRFSGGQSSPAEKTP